MSRFLPATLTVPDGGVALSGTTTPRRGIVIFSGGSAANSLVDVFSSVAAGRNCGLTYIIPISDNGGSSSELIRVFGGPGIGDVRSRLVRMIPPSHANIYALLNYRFPSEPNAAWSEWQSLVSGQHQLWKAISSAPRELLRSMLNYLNLEILKRGRPPHNTFNFASASVGNLFLTGARLFTGSFESAIYLVASIGGVPDTGAVVPAINSNFSHHIAAGLANGTSIVGQNAISHPSAPTALPESQPPSLLSPVVSVYPPDLSSHSASLFSALSEAHNSEDANLPGSLPTLRSPNIHFSKAHEEPLPARIARLWYINPYGQEITPPPLANPKAVTALCTAEAAVYSIGSLYTSIVPAIILRGIGEALACTEGLRFKVLILNGSLDRETGPESFAAADFVAAIVRAAEESRGRLGYPQRVKWKEYVTHVIYLEGDGAPRVDKALFAEVGVETVRCWGRKANDGTMRFDPMGLSGALEAILGKREWKGPKSRRNTLEG